MSRWTSAVSVWIQPLLFMGVLALSGGCTLIGIDAPSDSDSGRLIVHIEDSVFRPEGVTAQAVFLPGIDITPTQWSVQGTGPDGASFSREISAEERTEVAELAPGDWTVSVTARNDQAETVGTGSATTTVVDGATAEVSVTVELETGSGSVRLHLAWPDLDDSIITVQVSIGDWLETILEPEPEADTISTMISDIPTGVHDLALTYILSDQVEVRRSHSVTVLSGSVTDVTETLKPGFSESAPSIPQDLTVSEMDAESVTLAWNGDGSAVIGYVIERRVDGQSEFEEVGRTIGDIRRYRDFFVASAALVSYRVRAYSRIGHSDAGSIMAVVGSVPEDGITGAGFTDLDDRSGYVGGTISFAPPADETWIDEYRVYWRAISGGDLTGLEPVTIIPWEERLSEITIPHGTVLPPDAVGFNVYAANTRGRGTDPTVVTVADHILKSAAYSGDGWQVIPVDTGLDERFSLELSLGENPVDVFFVFTNTADRAAPRPQITGLPPVQQSVTELRAQALTGHERPPFQIAPPDPELQRFNRRPPPQATGSLGTAGRSVLGASSTGSVDEVGMTDTFYDFNSGPQMVPATCRNVTTVDGQTVSIWVEDASWNGEKATTVTQAMVDQLATRILIPGAGNDIVDWMDDLFGPAWGPHARADMIPATDQITVLLTDIDSDNRLSGPLVAGYFSGQNAYRREVIGATNERVMLVADSVLFALKGGSSWEITDPGPSAILSTVVHEFQHMIHFYQRYVRNGAESPTWLDEMISMVAQDVLAFHIAADGPRGAPYGEPSGGPDSLTGYPFGRLPEYVGRVGSVGLVPPWEYGAASLKHYANAYAFGAYLLRTFGVPLFREIVHSPADGTGAIEDALTAIGSDETMETLLSKWGAAVLLSGRTDTDSGYQYNTGSWFSSGAGTSSFQYGSINMNIYGTGVRIYRDLADYYPNQPGRSNVFFHAGEDVSGTLTASITRPSATVMSVVVRE